MLMYAAPSTTEMSRNVMNEEMRLNRFLLTEVRKIRFT